MIPVLGRAQDLLDEPRAGHGRILIVEDAPPVVRALRDALHKCGVDPDDIAHAATPEDALAAFRRDAPRLVFAEFLGVHAEDGLEVLHEMLDARPDVKIVLLTAEPRDAPEVRAAVRAGVFAVLEKPLRHDKVRATLQDLVSEEGNIERFR